KQVGRQSLARTIHSRSVSPDPSLFVSERAELRPSARSRAGWLLLAFFAATACAKQGVAAIYDPDTRLVSRVDYDDEISGHVAAPTYYSNGRAVRLEGDADGDGTVDRWEYYGADGALVRLGTSSTNDGSEDTWVVTAADWMRVDISTRHDGFVDRREFHQH